VTGGRPGRDPRLARRRERGPQGSRGQPGESPWTGTGGAELEELGAAAVLSPGGTGVGLRAVIAGVALVALLAVGFGAFGGRAQPSAPPVASPIAAASVAAVPTPRVAASEGPLVTPFEPCAVERNVVPAVWLEVAGQPHAGAIEVLDFNPDALPPDAPTPSVPESVEIGEGDATAIVIDGARCAYAWVIDFDGMTTIDVVSNGAMDRNRSAQNRFVLGLADNPGRESLLRAQLLFPGFSIRASWAIRVNSPGHPEAELHWLDHDLRGAVEGCFVEVQYGNGWREPGRDCTGREGPMDVKPVRASQSASFQFVLPEWTVAITGLGCGHGFDDSFSTQENACEFTVDDASAMVTVAFPATIAKGQWTLAIDACGFDGPIPSATVCGTWYAAVKVR
jgi:hypothetical protein